jgi:hypothetical protein
MQVDEQQILSFSRELWANQLGLSITPLPTEPGMTQNEKVLSSCINVSGPFQGAIVLECPESVVRHAAAMLFAADGDEPSEEDIHDALKELAAMVGKRMRSILPESTRLSRPSVVADLDRSEALERMQGLSDLKLSCEGRPVRIALLQKEEEATPAS